MDAHHYDEAIEGYTRAYEASPDPALLYNRGKAHEARGEYPAALADMESFAKTASPELRARVPKLAQLLNDLAGRVTTLQITCNVDGARVLVGGRVLGTTPLGPTRVNAGRTTIEVLGESSFPFKREIDLRGGSSFAIDATLLAKTTQGLLAVRTIPTGAVIVVDDKPFGTAPTEGLLEPGTHRVLARASGYEDKASQAVIESGARRDLDIQLEKASRSIFASPWFWTIAGVIVAGAVIGTIAGVAVAGQPGHGIGFKPDQVSGP